jgi:DNA-binding GntR family transcriptional regulator
MDTERPAGLQRSNLSARERAYLHIRRMVVSGEQPAGSAVSEAPLAKQLGISRTPIREALGQLVAEGLLEQTPNRGAVVVQLRRQDIVDLFELREALEVYAVGKAAGVPLKESDLDRLRSIAGEIPGLKRELENSGNRALNAEQMHRFMTHDLAFHTLLMRLAANARILKVVNETRLLIRIFAIHRGGHEAIELDRIHRQHCEMLDAVIAKDAELAMSLLAGHIQASCRERLDAYDHWERERSLEDSLPFYFYPSDPVEA